MRALINMEIKLVYIVIHGATVQHHVKNIDVAWTGGWGNTL